MKARHTSLGVNTHGLRESFIIRNIQLPDVSDNPFNKQLVLSPSPTFTSLMMLNQH